MNIQKRILLLLPLLCALFAIGPAVTAAPTDIFVTTNADSGPNSFRQALLDAVDGDTIRFASAMDGQTITLASELPSIGHNPLDIIGGNNISIDGSNTLRSGLTVKNGAFVTISNLNFVKGFADQGGAFFNTGRLVLLNVLLDNNATPTTDDKNRGGAVYNAGTFSAFGGSIQNSVSILGGGIYSEGDLVGLVLADTMTNTADYGGGIYLDAGEMVMLNATVSNNEAVRSGGGLLTGSNTRVDCTTCTFTFNESQDNGGSINVGLQSTLVMTDTNVGESSAEHGGGLYNEGTVTLVRNTWSGFQALAGDGAAINNHGTLTISDSTLSFGESPSGDGGILWNNATATILRSTLNNGGAGGGGVIFNKNGSLTLRDSALLFGQALSRGAGLFNDSGATATVTNSTFSGNISVDKGGGILNQGNLISLNMTVANNQGFKSGGYYELGTSTHSNSLFADNPGGDCSLDTGGSFSASYTLVENGGCRVLDNPGQQNISGDPGLQTLASNGGSTFTHAVLPGSIAEDAGNFASCDPHDQRGYWRHGFDCEVGAYEISDGICAAWDGFTEQVSLDSSAVRDVVGPIGVAGRTIKIAGTCVGATTSYAGTGTLVWVPVDMTFVGGHVPIRWGQPADPAQWPAILDADQEGRVITLNADASLTILDMTIENGYVLNTPGGGIYQLGEGDLTLNRVVVANNEADFQAVVSRESRVSGTSAGGIYSIGGGDLSIIASEIRHNSVVGNGGGLIFGGRVESGLVKDVEISDTFIHHNMATQQGGGLRVFGGTLSIERSLFWVNSAESGGAISGRTADIAIVNSTISHNTADSNAAAEMVGVGGIQSDYITVGITNTTVANNNAATSTAGFYFEFGTFDIVNTIIANDDDQQDCTASAGSTVNISFSIVRDASCIVIGQNGNQFGDPMLDALAENSGSTQTHAITADSIAYNRGLHSACPDTDQRREDRDDGRCDVGAFEVQPVPTSVSVRTFRSTADHHFWIVAGGLLTMMLLTRRARFGRNEQPHK